ncbi:MAG: hypothetical protein Q8900_13870 [Bacillota bacterium]|nr:hypothetical protein [Bacillota bacterium]
MENELNENKYNGIIIFGEMSTGKDALADYLINSDKRCCKYNIGNAVRQFFSIIKVNPEFRGKDRFLGQLIADKLREVHPYFLNDYCLSLIYEKWQKQYNWDNSNVFIENFNDEIKKQLSIIIKHEIPIIVGGRTKDDFTYWTNKNFFTVGIICDKSIKFERLCKRDGTLVANNSNFKHNTEIDVADIAKNKCNIVIDNSFDLQHLHNEADKLIKLFK